MAGKAGVPSRNGGSSAIARQHFFCRAIRALPDSGTDETKEIDLAPASYGNSITYSVASLLVACRRLMEKRWIQLAEDSSSLCGNPHVFHGSAANNCLPLHRLPAGCSGAQWMAKPTADRDSRDCQREIPSGGTSDYGRHNCLMHAVVHDDSPKIAS